VQNLNADTNNVQINLTHTCPHKINTEVEGKNDIHYVNLPVAKALNSGSNFRILIHYCILEAVSFEEEAYLFICKSAAGKFSPFLIKEDCMTGQALK